MDLTILVCAYDMHRELPRTIRTLSPSFQRDLGNLTYEIIVVDNGSPKPVDEAYLQTIAPNVRVIRVSPASPSPVQAINDAMKSASGQMLGLFIDGARMASPGLLHKARLAFESDPSKIIGTLAFHLGPDVQMRSISTGYNQSVEDRLLATIPWEENGYSLFDISVLAGSSHPGWFGSIAESNGVFLSRSLWDQLGGLDERFTSPGGGLVNLDFWKRAVELSDYQPWMVLGEGTFHQVHGGVATNGTVADRKTMFAEYQQVHGQAFPKPHYQPRLIGSLDPEMARKFIGTAPAPPRRVHSIGDRSFKVGIPPDLLDSIQAGSLKTRYKGLRLAKNPFDLVLYLQLLERLAPRTIIEIGTSEGGSALWFRDQCRTLGLETDIVSMDLEPPSWREDGISFWQVDSTRPDKTFPHARIEECPHPWLVTEDSAHIYDSVQAVLSYFDKLLHRGDYMVIEDGVVADLRDDVYRAYRDGPNKAVADFLQSRGDHYQIDTDLCDFFGPNVTYCPNSWLVRQ